MDVSIIILTYNQETTIERTINSILSQRTNYKYEIIVGDDASKDHTRTLCEKLANQNQDTIRIIPYHENYGIVRNYGTCLKQCTGRYLMTCAGDDWWHNLDKIQIEVDYMDAHPECSLLHSGFVEYYPATELRIEKKPLACPKPQFKSLIKSNPVCAPTACIRKSALDAVGFDNFISEGFVVEDYPMWLGLSQQGEIQSIDVPLVTYTQQIGSAHICRDYDKRIAMLDNMRRMRYYFAKKCEDPEDFTALIEDTVNCLMGETAVLHNRRKDAIHYFKQIKNKEKKTWLKIIVCIFPPLFKKYCQKYNKNY